MLTLKQVRQRLGINQSEVAAKINVSIPTYSNIENGITTPPLEDCVILERNFDQLLKWEESIGEDEKRDIMSALCFLSERYPLSAVLTFGQKYLREGQKIGHPTKFILHYAEVSKKTEIDEIEPLYPNDVKMGGCMRL